jgi:hypothetical protein
MTDPRFWTARCAICGRSVQASGPPLGWACARHAPILIGPLTEAERTRQALDPALDKLSAAALREVLELATRLSPPPATRLARVLWGNKGERGCAVCGTELGADETGPCRCPGWENGR